MIKGLVRFVFCAIILGSFHSASAQPASWRRTLYLRVMLANQCLAKSPRYLEGHDAGLAIKQNEPGFPRHLLAQSSWSSIRLDFCLWPGSKSPFCALTMPVYTHDGCIHHRVFHIWLAADCFKQASEHVCFDPIAEAFEYGVPFTKVFWQVTPWTARAGYPQNCLYKQLVICPASAMASDLA